MNNFVEMLDSAKQKMQEDFKPLYKRFIKGTPLENDIPVIMAEFAMQAIRPYLTATTAPAQPVVSEGGQNKCPKCDGEGIYYHYECGSRCKGHTCQCAQPPAKESPHG